MFFIFYLYLADTRTTDTETVSFPKQSISWTHNTNIHYLFITHTYFSFQICTCQTSHIIVCIVYLPYSTLPICIFVYYSFNICVLSCHSVAPWSFCHFNKFLVCVNWTIKLFLILIISALISIELHTVPWTLPALRISLAVISLSNVCLLV